MRSSARLSMLLAAAAMVGMTAGGSASISHQMNEGGPLEPPGGVGSTSSGGSANRRAKGAHKAARRASHKRRRAKARKS